MREKAMPLSSPQRKHTMKTMTKEQIQDEVFYSENPDYRSVRHSIVEMAESLGSLLMDIRDSGKEGEIFRQSEIEDAHKAMNACLALFSAGRTKASN